MTLAAKVEAILFFRAEPLSLKELAGHTKSSVSEVHAALAELEKTLSARGVSLVRVEDRVELRTAPEAAALIEETRREELTRDLGRAGSETLSIILYRGPVTRSEIDYIRGVNSTFILRNLLIRGLVEKIPNPKDQRSFLYKPTLELLSFLGIKRVEELPEFETMTGELKVFEEEHQQKEDD